MSLTTYSGLSTAVFSRLNRAANATDFDVAIELATAEINRRLALKPVHPMHTNVALTIDAGIKAVPLDYLDTEALYIGSDRVLATSLQNLRAMFEADDTTGQPKFYAQENESLRFYPAPDADYEATHIYWSKVPLLASGAATNWLSLAHPDVYFHGVLAHLYQQYFDDRAAETHAALFDAALEKVSSAYPSRQDRAPLVMDAALRLPHRFNIATG